jgi:hypothetical protein
MPQGYGKARARGSEVGRKRLDVLDAEACVEMLRGLERRLVSVRQWRALQVHAAAFSQNACIKSLVVEFDLEALPGSIVLERAG